MREGSRFQGMYQQGKGHNQGIGCFGDESDCRHHGTVPLLGDLKKLTNVEAVPRAAMKAVRVNDRGWMTEGREKGREITVIGTPQEKVKKGEKGPEDMRKKGRGIRRLYIGYTELCMYIWMYMHVCMAMFDKTDIISKCGIWREMQ